jgi:hypothetical protein
MAKSQATKQVFALLGQEQTAIEILRATAKQERSNDPVVRAIVDRDLGYVTLAVARPDDLRQERIIRLETHAPERALKILNNTPGVVVAVNQLQHLRP